MLYDIRPNVASQIQRIPLMKTKNFALAVMGLGLMVGSAFANPIASDLPADTYIIKDGLEWTWASPVNEETWGSNILSAPSFHAGWRFATDLEMQNRPVLADFTRPDGSYIQSAAYWNSVYTHVDAGDLGSGLVNSAWGHSWNETLYVAAVPEPETYALMLAGLGVVGAIARRKKKTSA
jgi:hypothetical protein